jgi:hypothetical protein
MLCRIIYTTNIIFIFKGGLTWENYCTKLYLKYHIKIF